MIAALTSTPAASTTLGDLQAQGYHIIHSSLVPGRFTGCLQHQEWSLADGSAFVCDETWHADSTNTIVVLLQTEADRTDVLLIGGHAYSGSMTQVGNRRLAKPLALRSVPDLPSVTRSGEPPQNHILAIEQVDSIDQLRERDNESLNTVQRYRPVASAKPTP
jgi:hypothetical protein